VNLSLYTSEKARKNSEGEAPLILELGTLYTSVFNLTPWSLYFLANDPVKPRSNLKFADK